MSDIDWTSVRQDLRAFCDLGGDVDFSEFPQRLGFSIPRNGGLIEGSVTGSAQNRIVRLEDGSDAVPYADFLASDQMGNLQRLARQTTLLERQYRSRSRKEIGSSGRSITLYDCFVPQNISVGGQSIGETGLDALDKLISADSGGGTRIAFLTAQAGQGKSSLLDVFTIDQANRYLAGSSKRLCLYVDAQGRGLARLDEAIARQLNDLQFMLSYNAIVSLVREGLLVLVVDGFDELIGSRGTYDDAFGSLSNFIEILEGRGTILAATRSSYFTQEYGSRGALLDADDSFAFELVLAELLPWDSTAQRKYFDRVVGEAALPKVQARRAAKDFERLQAADDAGLLSRPLFARDMTMLVIGGSIVGGQDEISSTSDLVAVLAASYLDREVNSKLLTRDRSLIVDVSGLIDYYVELAGDMWKLETRELDARSARESAELQAEMWGLATEARDIFLARYASLPFLITQPVGNAVAFEHEVFFAYFLAIRIAPSLLSGSLTQAQALLSKASLDEVASDFLASRLRGEAKSIPVVVERLCEVASGRHPREAQIRANCGALIAALLREGSRSLPEPLPVTVLRNVRFAGEDLAGIRLHVSQLSAVEFIRCDFRGAVIQADVAHDVMLREPLVDPLTTTLKLPDLGDVGGIGLRLVGDKGIYNEYDSARVVEVLRQIGLVGVEELRPFHQVDENLADIIAAIAQAYEQMNPIGTGHTRAGHLFTSKASKPVVKLLEKHGLVAEVTKAVSGPSQTFYRKYFVPSTLMEGLWSETGNVEIDGFWHDLAQLK